MIVIKLAVTCFISIVTGIVGHVVFFPIIESWSNMRMRRLARPAIGAMTNVVPFMAWLVVLEDERKKEKAVSTAFIAYCLSFLWHGAGVVLGYLVDDWR